MGGYARGKHALAISDRSGMRFPYSEMVREWNGSLVHYSEYESKQPQLEPKPVGSDPQALQNPRPQPASVASLILLVAMIGAILLTMQKQFNVRRQDVFDQVFNNLNASVRFVK